MLKVYYINPDGAEEGVYLRPAPLVSISETPYRNKAGSYGTQYDITIAGSILPHAGSPIYISDPDSSPVGFVGSGPQDAFASTVIDVGDTVNSGAAAIFQKQANIRELFNNFSKIEITDWAGNVLHASSPYLNSLNFAEGVYVTKSDYTINLQAYVLASGGTYGSLHPSGQHAIEDFSDSLTVEVDDSLGAFRSDKTYRVTRNVSATATLNSSGNPWEQARNYVLDYSSVNVSGAYGSSAIASGAIGTHGIPSSYSGVNHVRSENIDKSAGSYSLSDTWLLVPENTLAIETSNIQIQAGTDNAFIEVSIDGTIQGINTSGQDSSNAIENARDKYLNLSNSGQYGLTSEIFKRADNRTEVRLNSQPSTISVGINDDAGEITYNLTFNNRPPNVFTGVLSEVINVNDTYPGDVFAIIPVLGRSTGPVLQYTGTRTEYRRDLSIEIILDHTDIGYGDQRADLILRKPSVTDPIRGELSRLIEQLSPSQEPGIRKYFLDPPSESWNPKTGSYSINLAWTYELDK